MANDPIKAAMAKVNPSIPTSPHPDSTSIKSDSILNSLTAQVSSMGKELNAIKEIQSYKGPSTEPNELLLRSLWTQVYLSIINQIYGKGLSFWNNKPRNLEMELELAVIRSDEAIEAYIRTRNTVPDPVQYAQARWAREQLNKEIR
jgi:hypothetical protein